MFRIHGLTCVCLLIVSLVPIVLGMQSSRVTLDMAAKGDKKKIRVACVGDSITEGLNGTLVIRDEAYPAQLQAILGSKYDVMNFGISGATLVKKSGLLSYWDSDQYASALKSDPDIVVIQLGTNDAWHSSFTERSEFVRQFEGDYADLIKSFKELPSQPIVLMSLPPPMYKPTSVKSYRNSTLINEEYPTWLPLIAEKNGLPPPIRVFDAWKNHCPNFEEGPGPCDWMDDMQLFVHPNREGFHQIANVVASAIKESFPAKE
eukprot:TRINITY_DN48851_c0_g1_i1.p1 TRINITY_DN48851_c0_g1~~TRINITY_DN48851_c0_g1_i1.p1  ORF type:complete len:261 (+),score=32.76 TRINITY_DN48851_c0_g1_i1:70-852(+)